MERRKQLLTLEPNAFQRFLEALTLVLGPGVLLDLLFTYLGHPEIGHLAAILVIAAAAIVFYVERIGLRWFLVHKRFLLASILVIVPSVATIFVLHRPPDLWPPWERGLNKSLQRCTATDEQCIIKTTTDWLGKRPRPAGVDATSALAWDLTAGHRLLLNDKIQGLLKSKLSIGTDFIGAGLSKPVPGTNQNTAKITEFFVPNIPDSSPELWRWELIPNKKGLQNKVARLLNEHAAVNSEKLPFSLTPSPDEKTALIRFALVLPTEYSKCLGRPDATHVFMSDLATILGAKLTIEKAANLSGVGTTLPKVNRGERLFIWVYKPKSTEAFAPATWRQVLSNFEAWMREPSCPSAARRK